MSQTPPTKRLSLKSLTNTSFSDISMSYKIPSTSSNRRFQYVSEGSRGEQSRMRGTRKERGRGGWVPVVSVCMSAGKVPVSRRLCSRSDPTPIHYGLPLLIHCHSFSPSVNRLACSPFLPSNTKKCLPLLLVIQLIIHFVICFPNAISCYT